MISDEEAASLGKVLITKSRGLGHVRVPKQNVRHGVLGH